MGRHSVLFDPTNDVSVGTIEIRISKYNDGNEYDHLIPMPDDVVDWTEVQSHPSTMGIDPTHQIESVSPVHVVIDALTNKNRLQSENRLKESVRKAMRKTLSKPRPGHGPWATMKYHYRRAGNR